MQDNQLTQQTNQELLQAYKDALAKHDVYFQYSDDPYVYRKGLRTWEDLCKARINCIKAGIEQEMLNAYKEFEEKQAKAKRY